MKILRVLALMVLLLKLIPLVLIQILDQLISHWNIPQWHLYFVSAFFLQKSLQRIKCCRDLHLLNILKVHHYTYSGNIVLSVYTWSLIEYIFFKAEPKINWCKSMEPLLEVTESLFVTCLMLYSPVINTICIYIFHLIMCNWLGQNARRYRSISTDIVLGRYQLSKLNCQLVVCGYAAMHKVEMFLDSW